MKNQFVFGGVYQKLIALVVCLIAFAGCGKKTCDSQPSALVTTVDLWPDPDNIPVCWINPEGASDAVRKSLQDHLAEEYGEKTSVTFVGFEKCTESQMTEAVIRVFIRKDAKFGSGRSLVGAKKGIGVLPHGGTMELSVPTNWPRRGDTWRKKKVMYATLHEFGHALGLRHEHLREDAHSCKHATGVPPENSRPVGEYDTVSVMNYCSKSRTFRLSEGDVAGVEALYGKL